MPVESPCMDDHQFTRRFQRYKRTENGCTWTELEGLTWFALAGQHIAGSVSQWNQACGWRDWQGKTNFRQYCVVEDNIQDFKVGLFQHTSFAGDSQYFLSKFGGFPCVFWITNICTNFLDVQQEVNSRVCLTAVPKQKSCLWSSVWERRVFQHCKCGNVFLETCSNCDAKEYLIHPSEKRHSFSRSNDQMPLDVVDHVPSNVPESSISAMLFVSEDSEAVIPKIRKIAVPIWDTRHELTMLIWIGYLNESKWNDCWNALIVQERYSYWPHSYHTRSKDAHFFWGDAFFHSRRQEGSTFFFLRRHLLSLQTPRRIFINSAVEFIKAYQDFRWTHDPNLSTNQRDSRQSCSTTTRRNRNSDGSMWLTRSWRDRAKECCCCLRNAYNKMADSKTTYEKGCCVTFDGLLIPFGAKVSCKPISREECASIWQRDASQNLRVIRTTCGERMVRRLAYRGSRRHRELGTLRYPRQTVQARGNRTRRTPVVSMCRLNTQPLRSSSIPTRRNACQGNPEEDGKGIQLLGETCIYAYFPNPQGKARPWFVRFSSKTFGPENGNKIWGWMPLLGTQTKHCRRGDEHCRSQSCCG